MVRVLLEGEGSRFVAGERLEVADGLAALGNELEARGILLPNTDNPS